MESLLTQLNYHLRAKWSDFGSITLEVQYFVRVNKDNLSQIMQKIIWIGFDKNLKAAHVQLSNNVRFLDGWVILMAKICYNALIYKCLSVHKY